MNLIQKIKNWYYTKQSKREEASTCDVLNFDNDTRTDEEIGIEEDKRILEDD